ncbi:MAG: sugar phosphate isomerase/epimerase family protein [Vicinamibacterales bacterium]
MNAMSRREFFKKTAVDAAVAGFLGVAASRTAYANPLGLPIGSQTYPHRDRIVKGEFAGLLKDMKTIGIEVIELCNPAYAEFKSLADGKQTRKILDDNGVKCLSAHFTMNSLRSEQGAQIEWAQALGMTQMSTASIGGRVTNGMTTLEEVKRAADEYNKIAAAAKKAGLQQALHNEGFENSRLEDGRLTYPVLMEYLDPELVKMQFQMSSMRTVGDPIMYFTNHPGRFVSAHLQGVDTTQGMVTSRAGIPQVKPTPEEAAALAQGGGRGRGGRGAAGGGNALAVGEDTVDWAKVFTAAKTAGLKNYFVEQSWELTVKSVAFLKTLSIT